MPSIYLSPSTQQFNLYYDGNGNEEYYMNLIADAMIPYLDANGIRYTRNNPDQTVSQVIAQSNNGNYDLHLALHSNASPESLSGMLRGADFYYYTRSSAGRNAATVLSDNYMNIFPSPTLVKIMPTTSLAEVTRTRAPAVLAELAYHDNQTDAEWLKANINEIGKNLVIGLCELFDIPFREPSGNGTNTNGERYGTVRTQGGKLNIRDNPSLGALVIAQAQNGERLKVYCTSGNWYVVEYKGQLGFASSEYIDLE